MLAGRLRYQTNNGVSWPRIPVLVFGSLGASVLVAVLLELAFATGWYFVVLAPMIAGLIVGGLVNFLVGWTKCRNAWLAGALGMMTGAFGFLGYYYLSVAYLARALPNPMALHQIIAFRLRTDVIREVGRENKDDQVGKRQGEISFKNWSTFGFEFFCIAITPTVIA